LRPFCRWQISNRVSQGSMDHADGVPIAPEMFVVLLHGVAHLAKP
jgi:hypothetical protein